MTRDRCSAGQIETAAAEQKYARKRAGKTAIIGGYTINLPPAVVARQESSAFRRVWGTPSPCTGSILIQNRAIARLENFGTSNRNLPRPILGQPQDFRVWSRLARQKPIGPRNTVAPASCGWRFHHDCFSKRLAVVLVVLTDKEPQPHGIAGDLLPTRLP
jgi:hypothetical protein